MSDLKKFLRPKPVVLITLEGWGVARAHPANAISEASPAYFQHLISHYPALTLNASGKTIGSLLGQSSGSELGHLAIGLGRPVVNYCSLLDQEIASGNFLKSVETILATKDTGDIHLVGLVSNVQIEVSLHHFQSLVSALKQYVSRGRKIFLHVILDGRDMSPKAGRRLLEDIEEQLQVCDGEIASVTGRLYALDVYEHTARLEKTVAVIVEGKGNTAMSATQAVSDSYVKKIFDEEFSPTVILKQDSTPRATISKADTVIFFNFNPTSIRPLVRSLIQHCSLIDQLPTCISLVDYSISEVQPLYKLPVYNNFLGESIAEAGFRQIRIADSEGYVPITTFLNGGDDQSVSGEDRRLIPISISVDNSANSELSNIEVAKEVVKIIEGNRYDFIAVNFSSLDRLAHQSNIKAVMAGVLSIDNALRKIVEAVLQADGVAIIVGSHGVAEQLVSVNGEKFSLHTHNLVPFILAGKQFAGYSLGLPEAIGGDLSLLSPAGSLIDVAPTILKLMKLPVPHVMTGKSFFDELKLV
jgi:2,3-bisphosphoglycerate-independent phosphoglycerate mutase